MFIYIKPSIFKSSAQASEAAPKKVLEQFLNSTKQGKVDTRFITGPVLARSKLIDGKELAIEEFKIHSFSFYNTYATFEVWVKQHNYLGTYRYHMVSEQGDSWKISLIETMTPSLPDKHTNQVPEKHKEIIHSFIESVTKGKDVKSLFAYPLRSTIHTKAPVLPQFQPTTPVLTPVGGNNENSLVQVSYIVDRKPIVLLFHIISMKEKSQIAEIIPLE